MTPILRELATSPRLSVLFGKAALAQIRGRDHAERGLPDTRYVLRNVPVDRQNLAAYQELCCFRASDELPATYPHLLVFPLQIRLMTDDDFPFGLIGQLHLSNKITQVRPLRVDEPLTLRVRAGELRPHRRGHQFDLVSEVLVDGTVVWTEVSTYLRLARTGQRAGRPPRGPAELTTGEAPLPSPDAIWRAEETVGRRYAAISGDHNPIHLSALTARLFGYNRAIGHGMWAVARCLAAFPGLPAGLMIDVRFVRPIMLPSTLAVRGDGTEDHGFRFDLRDEQTGKPRLEGTVEPVDTQG